MINKDEFKFLDNLTYEIIAPHEYLPNGGLDISWDTNIGFGHYLIMFDENGRPCADTECMDSNDDKWFTKQILNKLVEEINILK